MSYSTTAPRRVCIVQRVVPHYRVPFFRSLHAALAAAGVELHLFHGQEFPGTVPKGSRIDASWSHPIENRYLRFARRELIWQPCLLQALRQSRLVIVEHASRLLLNYPLLAARTGSRRVAFWGHGANFQAHSSDSASESIKRRLARTPDWWFAYTEGGAKLVESCGYPRDRVTVVNNSIDSRRLREAIARCSDQERAQLRERLGLAAGRVALFCGRLVEEKRLDLLWSAALEIRRRVADFSLIVIGGGPLEAEARRMAVENDWIHYVGAKTGDDVAPYFAVSDFMLIPGLVGLVVVDAFAAGLPLVTTRIECHSPEIEYLQPGVNGLVSEPDAFSLANACIELLESGELRNKLKLGCFEAARRFTLEAMVDRFRNGVMAALDRTNTQ